MLRNSIYEPKSSRQGDNDPDKCNKSSPRSSLQHSTNIEDEFQDPNLSCKDEKGLVCW